MQRICRVAIWEEAKNYGVDPEVEQRAKARRNAEIDLRPALGTEKLSRFVRRKQMNFKPTKQAIAVIGHNSTFTRVYLSQKRCIKKAIIRPALRNIKNNIKSLVINITFKILFLWSSAYSFISCKI